MENWLLYVLIGLICGMIISFICNELELSDTSHLIRNRRKFLQQQRQIILNELSSKAPEKTKIKDETVALIYQFAASKNLYTLKDIELATKQIQNHYSKNLETTSTFKINFPEKEMLSFEPQESLMLLTIISEGLHNAALYSNANFIFSIASIEDERLHLITHDNGVGYNRKEIQDGNGIKTILKATSDLKGDLKLTSTIGNGTVVNVQIPIDNF